MVVIQFLKSFGITGLLKGRDKPKYVENIRDIYQPEELEALFNACDADEKVRYLFFLLTGERDREVRNTTWDDVDFVRHCGSLMTRSGSCYRCGECGSTSGCS